MTPTLPERLRAEANACAIEHATLPEPKEYSAHLIALLREAADAVECGAVWEDFARHQMWCADCAESVNSCPTGKALHDQAADAPPTDAVGGEDRGEIASIYRSHKRAVESDIADEDGNQ